MFVGIKKDDKISDATNSKQDVQIMNPLPVKRLSEIR